uniref:Beta-glucosidase (EC) n=1 Tax=Ganoderma boninense TaxID=34458 RepID=A0A5K1JVB4_9APHY|nr:Beta-glucosidase (EC [Ganoderma boninense]
MPDNADPAQPQLSSATLLLCAFRIGPIYIGPLLAWMLFGVSVVQLYIYHTSFFRDPISIRAAVYGIFALDVFQSVVVAAVGWQVLVSGWGRPINLQFPGWSFAATPFVSGITSVQAFYAWRIWRLGRWRVVPLAIIITGFASAMGAIIFAILFMFKKNIETFHETVMYSLCIVWLGIGAFTDFVRIFYSSYPCEYSCSAFSPETIFRKAIMLSMFYLLYSAKRLSMGRFEHSDFIVNKLMRLTVETGSACALTALLELAFFLGLPDTNVHIAL